MASPLLKNDNFKVCQLGAVTSVTPLCHFCVAKVFYDGTIILGKKKKKRKILLLRASEHGRAVEGSGAEGKSST